MNSKLWLGLITTAVFVVADGSAPRAYGAPPKDACSLLTPEQVSAALGVKVEAGQALTAKICKWSESVRPGSPAKRAMLNLIDPQAFTYAKTPVGNGIIKTEVSGIGDDAVYVSAHGMPTTLTVKKGAAAFTLTVVGFPEDQIKAKEKALAVEICSKL